MARKLKTYRTSAGFFDLAVAAPSMKAALETWGSKRNLFTEGFASQSEDAEIVAATMAMPGVVLKRAVGSADAFSEHAAPPAKLPAIKGGTTSSISKKPKAKSGAKPRKTDAKVANPSDEKAARRAATQYEKERARQETARRLEHAESKRKRARQAAAVATVESAFATAERTHDRHIDELEKKRGALDRRSEAEDRRWKAQKEKFEAALGRARR